MNQPNPSQRIPPTAHEAIELLFSDSTVGAIHTLPKQVQKDIGELLVSLGEVAHQYNPPPVRLDVSIIDGEWLAEVFIFGELKGTRKYKEMQRALVWALTTYIQNETEPMGQKAKAERYQEWVARVKFLLAELQQVEKLNRVDDVDRNEEQD